jgi:hypothetical protein
MEWIMIWVTSSYGSSCIKHTTGFKEKGEEIEKRQGLEIERRRGLKLKATRVEVGDEG